MFKIGQAKLKLLTAFTFHNFKNGKGRKSVKNHKLYKVWSQVPVTYYQKGVRGNALQKIWHTKK